MQGKLIERIKARRDAFFGEARPHLDIAEWGDETGPLRVYWKPVTLAERRRCFGGEDGQDRGFARLVALKAEDAGGNRLFPDGDDAMTLERVGDAALVGAIALRMLVVPTLKEAEKN